MCRHLAYLGTPITLHELIAAPPHSLFRQSWAPRRQRHGVVNADGFGAGWYAPDVRDTPARYRKPIPMWTDQTFANAFGSGDVGPLPSLILWTLGVVLVGHFVYRHRRFGAHVLAAGDNAAAARVTGIRVNRVKLAVLVGSATLAALAGLLYAGRLQGANYNLGSSDLLLVIAAVVIGGTRLFGGSGTVVGALVGSLIMGMLNNGLILMGLSSSEQLIAQGVLLLLAISLTLREPKA